MRSLTADAAIVAAPSLAASGAAIWSAERLFVLAAEHGGALPSMTLSPMMAALAFMLTWAGYYLVVRLLAFRALSTSNALILFLLLIALLTVLTLLTRPEWSIPLLSAAAGSALALRLVRLRPRRRFSPV